MIAGLLFHHRKEYNGTTCRSSGALFFFLCWITDILPLRGKCFLMLRMPGDLCFTMTLDAVYVDLCLPVP